MLVNCLAPMCDCLDLLKWYKSVIQGLVTIFFYYGSKIGSTVRYAARNGTCDIDIWLGVDSEWQVDYLFHSSLGDSLSILDRILWKGSLWWNLISGLRDTVMFLHELPQTMGEGSVAGQRSRGIVKRRGKGRRWIGLCRVSPTSLSLYLSSSLMTNGSSCNLLSIQTGSQLFFLCLPFVPMLWQASKLIKLCPRIWHYSVLASICWLLLIFFDTSFKNQWSEQKKNRHSLHIL